MAVNVVALKRNPLNAVVLLFIIIDTMPSTNGILGNSCVTPSGGFGECTSLANCEFLKIHIRQYSTSMSSRNIINRSSCGTINGNNIWCCPKSAPQRLPPFIPNVDECGPGLENRIANGENTKIEEFPWMALLKYKNAKNVESTGCAGVIINKRYILTAAHCVTFDREARLVEVILGEYNIKTNPDCEEDDCVYISTYAIESYTIHGQYKKSNPSLPYDIALLRLATDINYNYYIQPICLPIINPLLRTTNFIGDSVYVAGWGQTENRTPSDIKRKVVVPVKSNIQCNKDFQASGQNDIQLSSKQLCAGGTKGTCRGDSGGPLMALRYDESKKYANWYVIGIVSIGPSPCDSDLGLPGIYTNVQYFNNWIVQNMED